MMRLVVLVTTAVVGLLVTTLLACDSQTVAHTDSAVPVANSVKATQGLVGASDAHHHPQRDFLAHANACCGPRLDHQTRPYI